MAIRIRILDRIHGGKADLLDLQDLVVKHDVSYDQIKKEFDMGVKIEMEHTDDPDLAAEIARDHLSEFPDYYSRLQKMEKDSEQLLEYVVPMGFSLENWKKHRKEHSISNADYHKQHPEKKWKVVHGHKRGQIGEPVNDKAVNLSYDAANKMHSAIVVSQGK